MKTGKSLLPALLALLTFAVMAASQASGPSQEFAGPAAERGPLVVLRFAKSLFHFASMTTGKP